MIVVSDTSSITALIQVGKADLLHKLYGEVFIPEAVREELLKWHESLPLGSVRGLVKKLERVADFHLAEEIKSIAFRKAGEL